MTKTCSKCKQTKSIKDFYRCKKNKDSLLHYCKSCCREYNKKYYAENRSEIGKKTKEIQIGRRKRLQKQARKKGCAICGTHDADKKFHWHHTDPNTKKYQLSNCGARTIKAIKKELKKCVPLCASCHTSLHCKIKNVQKFLDTLQKIADGDDTVFCLTWTLDNVIRAKVLITQIENNLP